MLYTEVVIKGANLMNFNDPFADMKDDVPGAPVASFLHPFEARKLGKSPFHCTNVIEGDSACAYCGTKIKYEFHIIDSEGKSFRVGSECVKQTGSAVAGFSQLNARLQGQLRGRQKQVRAAKKAARVFELQTQWKADNAVLFAWLESKRLSNNFAASLLEWLGSHGTLTEGQQATAERSMKTSAEREIVREQEKTQRIEAAPEVVSAKLEEAFAKAKGAGIRYPKIVFEGLKFKPAPSTGNNPGAIYVTVRTKDEHDGEYLGKVMGGKFLKMRQCTPEQEARVVELVNDPKKAAEAYGLRTGECCICTRTLTNKDSIERGIGPICAGNFGW
jgi:hypothetical protein